MKKIAATAMSVALLSLTAAPAQAATSRKSVYYAVSVQVNHRLDMTTTTRTNRAGAWVIPKVVVSTRYDHKLEDRPDAALDSTRLRIDTACSGQRTRKANEYRSRTYKNADGQVRRVFKFRPAIRLGSCTGVVRLDTMVNPNGWWDSKVTIKDRV